MDGPDVWASGESKRSAEGLRMDGRDVWAGPPDAGPDPTGP
jgi:hypothetical protein